GAEAAGRRQAKGAAPVRPRADRGGDRLARGGSGGAREEARRRLDGRRRPRRAQAQPRPAERRPRALGAAVRAGSGLVAETVPDYADTVRRVGVLMLVLSVAVVTAAVAYAAQSPTALRASILRVAQAQHSVHYATHEVDGNALLKISADVAAADGRQHVSFKVGKVTGQVTILVLDDMAYVEGDANGLE